MHKFLIVGLLGFLLGGCAIDMGLGQAQAPTLSLANDSAPSGRWHELCPPQATDARGCGLELVVDAPDGRWLKAYTAYQSADVLTVALVVPQGINGTIELAADTTPLDLVPIQKCMKDGCVAMWSLTRLSQQKLFSSRTLYVRYWVTQKGGEEFVLPTRDLYIALQALARKQGTQS